MRNYRIEKYINYNIYYAYKMYIRNKSMQQSKKKYYVIEDRVKVKGKYITKNIRYIGTAQKLLSDLKELDRYKLKNP